MPEDYLVHPIGIVRNSRTTPQDDDWDRIVSVIDLDAALVGQDALRGLSDFSHAEVVFLFDRVRAEQITTGSRHPRGNTSWPKVGIFSQRGKGRPNRIGVTVCSILEVAECRLTLKGLDAIDGTPVLDIKPVMSGFERRGDLREPDWARTIMGEYWEVR